MDMNGRHSAVPPAARLIQDLRTELAKKIAWFIGPSEKRITEVPGLVLVRRTAPTAPCTGTYTPSVIVVAQGSKRVELGQTTFIYDQSRFLLTSIDLPIVSQVIDASEAKPLLALALGLEMTAVRELLSREEVHVREVPRETAAMVTGEITAELLSACCRLIDLLANPQDIPVSKWPHSTRNHLPASVRTRGRSPSSNCNIRRSKPSHSKSDLVDQGQLCETGARG